MGRGMVRFIMAHKAPKAVVMKKELREPLALEIGVFNLAERKTFKFVKKKNPYYVITVSTKILSIHTYYAI